MDYNKNLLPLGSVITLNGAEKKLMITGVLVENEGNGKVYDYIGIPFPEGYLDAEHMFLFMHKDIQDVNFLGYINAEAQAFRVQLFKAMEEQGVIQEKPEE